MADKESTCRVTEGESLRPHEHGFITSDPFAAHDELLANGWRQVSNQAAADPKLSTERVMGLYAKEGRMAWLICDETVDVAWAIAEHIFAQPEKRKKELLGIVEMHLVMHDLKETDPEKYAETAAAIGWED